MKSQRIGLSSISSCVLVAVLGGCALADGDDLRAEAEASAALSSCGSALAPVAITANGDDGNVPANVADGNLDSRWSRLGKGSFVQFDLGAVSSICAVQIAWHKGNQRTTQFVVSASSDGVNFDPIHSGTSTGKSTALESYAVAAKNGRYLRVTVNGNSTNDWASITELRVFGNPITTPPSGTIVSPANLQAALDAAKGGETFRVGPGTVGQINLTGRTFRPAITVVAADPAKRPDLGFATIDGAEGVTISGVRMSRVRGNGVGNVSLVGNELYGNPSSPVGACIDIRSGSHDVRIAENTCRDAVVGIMTFGHTRLTVEKNDVDAVVSDSYKIGGLTDFTIARNIGARTINRLEESHPDFMQIQGALSNGTIAENVSLPASQPYTQGIFGGGADSVLSNVTIVDNILMGAHLRQISVNAGAGVVIEHNTVLDVPGVNATDSSIVVSAGSAIVRKNIWFGNNGSAGENLILTTEKPGTPFNHEKIFTSLELGMNASKLALLPGAPTGYGARITCPW